MKSIKFLIVICLFITLVSACGGRKKCNGRSGTRVEMGRM